MDDLFPQESEPTKFALAHAEFETRCLAHVLERACHGANIDLGERARSGDAGKRLGGWCRTLSNGEADRLTILMGAEATKLLHVQRCNRKQWLKKKLTHHEGTKTQRKTTDDMTCTGRTGFFSNAVFGQE